VVNNCEILLYYKSNTVGRISSTGLVNPNGTTVSLSPITVDAARIRIDRFAGTFRYLPVSGLAEVETVARISQE
jgi:hypothetical protein